MEKENRYSVFIRSMARPLSPGLERLRQQAEADYVPVIRREMQDFLRTQLGLCRPKRILEVGTAVGFSALFMAECVPDDTRIVTIENYEKRIPVARENIKKAGRDGQITLIPGDAQEVLKTLDERFEFIFMDAAKGQYLHFLEDILRLLSPGGVLISDNIFQDGEIIESRFAVTRRDRTIHSRMREYLYVLTHCDLLDTALLPLGDGVALSVRRQEPSRELSES